MVSVSHRVGGMTTVVGGLVPPKCVLHPHASCPNGNITSAPDVPGMSRPTVAGVAMSLAQLDFQ